MSKIPDSAKKVFSGVIFDVWQWEQEMYDGTHATFERVSRPSTVEVIMTVGDKIVIQRQSQPDRAEPFLSLVGGRVEVGEDMLEAAKRETLEETGYVSEDWELVSARQPSGKIDWTISLYVARNAKKVSEQNLDAGEKIELLMLTFDEILTMVNRGELRRMDQSARIDLIHAFYDPEIRKKWETLIFKR